MEGNIHRFLKLGYRYLGAILWPPTEPKLAFIPLLNDSSLVGGVRTFFFFQNMCLD